MQLTDSYNVVPNVTHSLKPKLHRKSEKVKLICNETWLMLDNKLRVIFYLLF